MNNFRLKRDQHQKYQEHELDNATLNVKKFLCKSGQFHQNHEA